MQRSRLPKPIVPTAIERWINSSHTDHIRPIIDGGTGEWTNLVEACSPCNLEKNGTEFWEFLHTKTKKDQYDIIRRLDRLRKVIPLKPDDRTEFDRDAPSVGKKEEKHRDQLKAKEQYWKKGRVEYPLP